LFNFVFYKITVIFAADILLLLNYVSIRLGETENTTESRFSIYRCSING